MFGTAKTGPGAMEIVRDSYKQAQNCPLDLTNCLRISAGLGRIWGGQVVAEIPRKGSGLRQN